MAPILITAFLEGLSVLVVEIAGARALQARCPIRAMVHLVAAALEEIPDVGGDVRLVLDEEDPQAIGRGGIHAARVPRARRPGLTNG